MENPVHGESRQAGLIVLCTVTLTMAVVAVALRCWSIYVLPLRKFGLDDFFAIATLVSMPKARATKTALTLKRARR